MKYGDFNPVRLSEFRIHKKSLINRTTQIKRIIERNQIEYWIYKRKLPSRILLPKPTLIYVIVCKPEHIIANNADHFKIRGIRYPFGDDLTKYLSDTNHLKRVHQNVRVFK